MLIDATIIVVAIGSFFYGRDIGFIRNFSSALGFFSGVFIGAYLQAMVISQSASTTTKSTLVVVTALGLGIIFLTIGEYFGIHLKHQLKSKKYIRADKYLGSFFSLIVLLICVWLLSALSLNLPFTWLQKQVDSSYIITKLNNVVPEAPIVVDNLAYKLSKTSSASQMQLQELGVDDSVYKIISQGCNELKVGSGFKVADNLVATNAHVVAGIPKPHIKTKEQILPSDVVYIDSDLDFALLKAKNLPGKKLVLDGSLMPKGMAVSSLGYSNGGPIQIKKGQIEDLFYAKTNNIFNDKIVKRQIYEISVNLQSGDSGGPVINNRGKVIGMAFAESTTDKNGYGIMSTSIIPVINVANEKQINVPVPNNRCSKN